MTLRTRILLTLLLLVGVPLTLALWLGRNTAVDRLSAQYEDTVHNRLDRVEAKLAQESRRLEIQLRALAQDMADDEGLRTALLSTEASARRQTFDYASTVADLAGLEFLRIQDAHGQIRSSGHFRNEFGTQDPSLLVALRRSDAPATLVSARSAEGPFLAWARLDSCRLADQIYYLIGGLRVDQAWLATLAGDEQVRLGIEVGSTSVWSRPKEPWDRWRSDRPLPHEVPAAKTKLVVAHSGQALDETLRALDVRLAALTLLVLLGAGAAAQGLAGRISGPISTLAQRTRRVDLDHLRADFPQDGPAEVGELAQFLGEMVDRLRTNRDALRDAENRATIGELARQVHHDVRNGVTPIRNVVRHLGQVAAEESDTALASTFRERLGTLEKGLAYLEELSDSYARLGIAGTRHRVDLNQIVRDFEDEALLHLSEGPLLLWADSTALRRISSNLIRNAREASPGELPTVATGRDESGVWLEIRDRGPGIAPEVRDRIFEPFFSHGKAGSGLGLAIVRRLADDHDAKVRLPADAGGGTVFRIEFPSHDPHRDSAPAPPANNPTPRTV